MSIIAGLRQQEEISSRPVKASVSLLAVAVLLVGGLLLGMAQPASAQEGAGDGSVTRTITVVGQGTVSIEPDVAQAVIGVEVSDASVQTASREAEQIMEDIIAALNAAGIADKDVQTAGYSIWADRGYGPEVGPDTPPIYRVNNNVSVTIRDLDSVGRVLETAIEAGANTIHGVTFSVSEPGRLTSQARALAAEDARSRAEELAALHGVAVGEVLSISEVIGGALAGNFSRVAAVEGLGGGPIAPGELELSMQLQVTYAMAESTPGAAAPAPDQATTSASQGASAASTESGTAMSESAVVPAAEMPGTEGYGGLEIVGEDGDALRGFLERWLAPQFSAAGEGGVTLVLGALPEDMPFRLPLPDRTTVVGSLVNDGPLGVNILLESEQSADVVTDLLARTLIRQGFERRDPYPRAGGFVSSSPGITLCRDRDSLYATVVAIAADEGPTDVRLSVQEDEGYGPCQAAKDEAGTGPQALLPQLQSPDNTRSLGGGGGGGNEDAYATSDLISPLSAADLGARYAEQLQDAGWRQVDAGGEDAVSWSTWTFADDSGDTWSGILLVLDKPGVEDGRFALLRIDRAD